MKKIFITLGLILLLTACADPIPKEQSEYIGYWQSEQMAIQIFADGNVSYKRVNGNATTSVDGPLKEFVGDDFVVGVLFMTTTFNVSSPPEEIDGVWKMTVDGVELVRKDR